MTKLPSASVCRLLEGDRHVAEIREGGLEGAGDHRTGHRVRKREIAEQREELVGAEIGRVEVETRA
jgi:hypothetical protein